MALATFFSMLGVTVLLGCVFCVLQSTTHPLNLTVKTLTCIASLMLALVSANLASAFGGYTLFICLGLAVVVGEETYRCVKYTDPTPASVWFLSGSNLVSLLAFTLAGILLAPFTPWGLLGGAALGLGACCIMLLFKRYSWSNWLAVCSNVVLAGAMLGQSLALLLSRFQTNTAIIYLVAAFFVTFQLIFSVFARHDKTMRIICNVARVISLILLPVSVFLLG